MAKFTTVRGQQPSPIGKAFFPRLFAQDDNGKYTVLMIFPESAIPTDAFRQLVKAADAAASERWGYKSYREKGVRSPFKTADDYPDFMEAGEVAIRFKSSQRPGVVGHDRSEINSAEDFRHGCLARVTYSALAYDHPSAGKGVSFFLNNVQWCGVGDGTSGKPEAASEFDDVPMEEAAADF